MPIGVERNDFRIATNCEGRLWNTIAGQMRLPRYWRKRMCLFSDKKTIKRALAIIRMFQGNKLMMEIEKGNRWKPNQHALEELKAIPGERPVPQLQRASVAARTSADAVRLIGSAQDRLETPLWRRRDALP